ncbi:DNA polymerase III subunit gamma/tau [Alginatibacterium sediminis]|uniref:DNA polymerase III subunit gamma/tau n=1 Tax=Alginatibacterium sediminis TaxID=2164068 RepID=A0A420EHX2_9ALTE|nr:DNA polymerase III subunit gamma/tau [Alginatibacterium sediminis]RKF20254.1 DNA polymerase III subunit gamma/tau [Alginatibacterium sediminis]
MAFKALARTWRPQTFADVVGQEHVLTALVNSLEQNSVHHAYLFTGTRGVGKTSIARLFAKSLNCEQGVSSSPCGECSSCKAVEQGNYVDLLEIDAASRTKVEDTRELLENVQYRPSIGRYKIYLIDEVHMLSRHSFNALLKTLEEPPEHVKFLLATTDPQKLPITVISRCLQFQLKAFSQNTIANQLVKILSQEQRSYDRAALDAISEAANGSMRDALSLSDQALALGGGQITHAQVLAMLGNIDPHQLTQLLCYVVSGDADQAFRKLEELSQFAPDYQQLHHQLAKLLHQIAMSQVLPGREKNETMLSLAAQLDPQQLQLYYQIVVNASQDLQFAPSPKLAFEMTLLRLIAFVPENESNAVFAPSALNDGDRSKGQVEVERAPAIAGQNNPSSLDQSQALIQEQDELLAQAQQQGYSAEPSPSKVHTPDPNRSSQEQSYIAHAAVDSEPVPKHDESVLQSPVAAVEIASAVQTEQLAQNRQDAASQAIPEARASASEHPVSSSTQDLVALRDRMRQRGQGPKKTEQVDPAPITASTKPSRPSHDLNTELVENTHKAPNVDPKLIDYSPERLDEWWELQTDQLNLGPIARQMCRAAVLSFDGQWHLWVAPEAAALAKQNSLIEIQNELTALLGLNHNVDLQYAHIDGRRNPALITQQRHIDNLDAAAQRLSVDTNVSFIVHNLGGVMQEQSLRYLD